MPTETRTANDLLTGEQIETLFRARLPGATVRAAAGIKGTRATLLVVAVRGDKRAEMELRSGRRSAVEAAADALHNALA